MRLRLNVQRYRLLCLVIVFRTRKYPQLREHLPTKRIAWQHAFYREFKGALGRLAHQCFHRYRFQIAYVPGVTMVHFVFHLVAGHANLVGVDDNNVIAGIDMWRIFRLVLAAEASCDLGGQAPQGLARGINQVPVAPYFLRLGRKRLHDHLFQLGRIKEIVPAAPAKGAKFYSEACRNANQCGHFIGEKPDAIQRLFFLFFSVV